MSPHIFAARTACCALTLGLAAAMPAWAGLGASISDAACDGTLVTQTTHQSRQVSAAASGTTVQTRTLQTTEGATVVEYADASGTVFALTWQGPFAPDLSQLFGTYFSAFKAGSPDQAGGLNVSRVSGQDIVVRTAGRMGGFLGVAWVPSLVPAGFDPTALQP